MASSQRPGEITYYEELGVDNTASSDEIRDAFWALARLLHPDQQTDPQLRGMAERQMRKLNRIYAVLSDSARRTAYDESLNSSRTAPIIVFSGSDGNLKKLLARLGAVAAVVLGVLFLIWFMATSNNTEVRGQETRSVPAGKTNDSADGDPGEQIASLRDRLRTAETERDSALEQLGRLAGKASEDNPRAKSHGVKNDPKAAAPGMAGLSAATRLNEMPSVTAPLFTNSGLNDPITGSVPFDGLWVNSRGSGSAVPLGGKSEYPPEFIEVTLTEVNGELHGEYRSRYQVLDHAMSPDVNFDFSGTPVGYSLNCAWRGSGAARGRVTLRLMPDSTVQIAWNATELGSQQWLASGTATLVRK